ncbi:MAG TPA: hypothetical protein VIX89_02410 [Bryobacteraceae bacterium]
MNGIPNKPHLRFGIPALDDLFGSYSLSHRADGIPVSTDKDQARLTIIGPAGSGKSILALHLASRYAADVFTRWTRAGCKGTPPKVIYVSTDLTLEKAQAMWEAFRLDRPNLREVPFYRSMTPSLAQEPAPKDHVSLKVELYNLLAFNGPDEDNSLAAFLRGPGAGPRQPAAVPPPAQPTRCQPPPVKIGFLDLLTTGVGDAWTFASHLLAALDSKPDSKPGSASNSQDGAPERDQSLIFVDNVDGFQAQVGEVNAFGEPSSVRARVMQTLKAARHRAHLVFVSEEQGVGTETLIEESDVVVRLHLKEQGGYLYRSVEVQKARAQAIHRGDHYLLFRTGSGSTTGMQENADDPRTCNAYVMVMPSLHTVSRRVMNEPTELRKQGWAAESRRAGFGLRYLDELCGGAPPYAGESSESSDKNFRNDPNGLCYGTLTGIIGDSNTYKSALAQKFLLRPFELFAENMDRLFRGEKPGCGASKGGSFDTLKKVCRAIQKAKNDRMGEGVREGVGEPPEELQTIQKLSERFQQLTDEKDKARLLADVLIYGRAGFDDVWTAGDVARKLAGLNRQQLPPELTLLCAQWAGHLLSNRLRSLFEEERVSPDWVRNAFLNFKQRSACRKIIDLLEAPAEVPDQIPWSLIVDLAVDEWGLERPPGVISVRAQFEFESSEPLNNPARIVERVAEVSKFRDPLEQERFPFEDAADEIRRAWGLLRPFDLLRLHLPGSIDCLTGEQIECLKKEEPGQRIQFLDADAVTRLLVGMSIAWINTQVHRENATLQTWLNSIPGLGPLNGELDLETFWNSIVDCLAEVGTQADQESIAKFARPPGGTPAMEGDEPNWTKVLPQIVFTDKPGKENLDSGEFTRWLFEMSPRTHPYAFSKGEKALHDDVRVLEEPGPHTDCDFPVFCSSIVALTLNLVRDHRVELRGHIEDELYSRRKAAESLESLQCWLEKNVGRKPNKADSEDSTQDTEETAPPPATTAPPTAAPAANIWDPGAKSTPCVTAIWKLVVEARKRNLIPELLRDCRNEVAKIQGIYFVGTASPLDLLGDDLVRLQFCRLVLEAASREGLLDGPAVLVTTKDVRLETLRDQYSGWMTRYLDNHRYHQHASSVFLDVAKDHLLQWLIVRRLEIHFLDPAAVSSIVRVNVEACQRIVFAPADSRGVPWAIWETEINIRRRLAAGIRLAVDGLAALRQTYPNVLADPLFLPAFKFYVSRENLTAIVVASQKGRPDEAGDDKFERQTVDLFLNQIRIWRVLFFGELRVALSVIPPSLDHGKARVRELAMLPHGELDIAPHFELYKNLEKGQPEAVALELRLTGGAKMLPMYQNLLDAVLTQTFPTTVSTPKPPVVQADLASHWIGQRRDFGRLHRESHLDHTLLLQVDEYWSFGRSDAFRPQAGYLHSKCTDVPGFHRTDPLEVFQRTLADFPNGDERTRFNGFHWEAYAPPSQESRRRQKEYKHTDRIPFMWDFGFLLCDGHAWKKESGLRLSILNDNYKEEIKDHFKDGVNVGHVWESLTRLQAGKEAAAPNTAKPGVPLNSWRVVLEAAVEVGARQTMGGLNPAPALDLTMAGGESLVCLILEMWASEVYQKYLTPDYDGLMRPYFERFTKRSWLSNPTQGIIGLIAEPPGRGASLKQIFTKALSQGRLPKLLRHSLELYKVLILLREAFNAASVVPGGDQFQFKARPVNPDAICARHWYASACDFLEGISDVQRYEPVRLPGHFSVRGDSYLAVARGSQSSLLADRALDLLSSRRGNHERLRFGLGLPVRDVANRETGAKMRTRLPVVDTLGRRTWVGYQDLKKIGADDKKPEWDENGFHWLWRSTLGDYDAQARALHAGIYRIMEWWKDLRVLRSHNWKSGFDLYDALNQYYLADEEGQRKLFEKNFQIYSLWEFPEICDELVDRLRHATPRNL